MKTKIYIFLLLPLFFMNTSCSKEENLPAEEQQMKDSTFTLTDGTAIRFSAYFPKDYTTNNTKRALIIALHYGWSGNSSKYYGKSMIEDLIKPAADELNCIAVAPDCPAGNWVEGKSISAVIQLLEYAKKKYNIDTNKIIITGYSLGGIGTGYLLAHYSNLFSSGVIVSASLDSKSLIGMGIKKFYAIHGLSDEVFPFLDVQKEANLIKMQNPLFDLISLPGLSHYDVKKFQGTLKNCIVSLLK